MDLNRCTLIQCAMLVGCDYTSGLKGVGFRRAIEILKAFADDDGDDDSLPLTVARVIAPLRAFATWFRNTWTLEKKSLRNKLGSIVIEDTFPEEGVASLFVNPVTLCEEPVFGKVDGAGLKSFLEKHFCWTGEKLAKKIKGLEEQGEEEEDEDEEEKKNDFQKRSNSEKSNENNGPTAKQPRVDEEQDHDDDF